MSSKKYSEQAERDYYSTSKADRRAIPYDFLSAYVASSLGSNFFRGKRVLDVGSGEGVYSAWIADGVCGGAKSVVGLELIEHRIRREYQLKLPNLTFINGNVLDIEPKPEDYDIVFMNLVLHHMRLCLEDVVDYIYRSLPSGGKFAAIEPNAYSPIAMLAHLINSKSRNEGFLTPHRIKSLLMSRGFSGVNVGYFWRDMRWARNPLLASSFYVIAIK